METLKKFVEKKYSVDGKDREYTEVESFDPLTITFDEDLLGYRFLEGCIIELNGVKRYVFSGEPTHWIYIGKRLNFEEIRDLAYTEGTKEYVETYRKMVLKGQEEVVECSNNRHVFLEENDITYSEMMRTQQVLSFNVTKI